MNVNFGLLPPIDKREIKKPEGYEGRWRGKDKQLVKKKLMAKRALADFDEWIGGQI